ncbi:MAG: dephospho-CoA kinase [Clostridia bacterium]|nr:dephospho-CoA kinase [Clostridia bacterium]
MKVKQIAITGGIGSGKTEVLNILNERGYHTISCDKITYDLYLEQSFLLALKELFPFAVHGSPLVADKKAISKEVFSNKQSLEKLNNLVHPIILERINQQILGLKNIKDNLVFIEVPLLFESGFNKYYKNVIIIKRDLEERINSIMARSNLTKEEIESRINTQVNYESLPLNNYLVLENNGTKEDLTLNITKILNNLI